jgi:predicted nucleic acid-binding protein
MPAVVSDTSVINYLAAVGQTDLLRIQFGRVYVPPAVWRELHARPNLPGIAPADLAQKSGWLVVQEPKPGQPLNQLRADLDPGEAEAIALACEFKPAIVLLDETDGRLEARRLGLTIIGTIGILAAARQAGQVKKIKPLLDRLMQVHRFRLSQTLYGQLIAGDKAD